MKDITKLSYSTINMLYTAPHNWLNRQMQVQVPDNEYFKNGKRLHRIIQDHLSSKVINENLKHINYGFEIVEEKEFDDRCRIEIKIDDEYIVTGFVDGLDPKTKRIAEIKTAGKMWTIGDFVKSNQRKVYALAKPDFTQFIGITALSDELEWPTTPPKVYPIELTEQDRKDALEWIKGGIAILEKGDFKSDLVDGKCVNRFCLYGNNCLFK